MTVRRIFVEKRQGVYDIPAQQLCADLRSTFNMPDLQAVRLFNRYDIEGLSDDEYLAVKPVVFSEPPVDVIYEEELPEFANSRSFAVEFLPGQYDQTADSAAQCVQLVTQQERPIIATARVIVLIGDIDDATFEHIKAYCINKVESREASLEKPETLAMQTIDPPDVKVVEGFISFNEAELQALMKEQGFAMSDEDLAFCQKYFAQEEHRDPTITELKVIDTYWSDHCRHTTFTTAIDELKIDAGAYSPVIEAAYQQYKDDRADLYVGRNKDVSLMDMAVIGMKALRKAGKLDNFDQSEEINACSIVVDAEVNGKKEEWLVMFKNETHNHPTEIEPFGGAATCLGGAIRDPLSGRSYVYQAMRVTGAGDPRRKLSETLPGKLPQRKITREAARGYSSYGNQIGLATGQVVEMYHEGYVAKRMEIGAVMAAAPKVNVVRERPAAGDIIVLVGGRTGRDGCGGATGSSKEHTTESLATCGAEVQKGNAPTERKIQRLFRNPAVSQMIKRCNDFGAGGVSVAIGELAEGLIINLDAVKKKYEGLDGTELAISESQERMAVVIDANNLGAFCRYADEENLETALVATVTEQPRLVMNWRGKAIVQMNRSFLDTNGVKQHVKAVIAAPDEKSPYLHQLPQAVAEAKGDAQAVWLENLRDLNVCSQKGLSERFDSTVGANTVLMPFGGKTQLTPAEGMAARLPVIGGESSTATAMTFGLNPYLMEWSPFHGALYAVVESAAKIVAMGGRAADIRLTFQEYFESLGKDAYKWGKPASALLGALVAQHELGIAAIGGKDSMSGTFMDIHVPPTLASFAVTTLPAGQVISPEFKQAGSRVLLVPVKYDQYDMPDFAQLQNNFAAINQLAARKQLLAAKTVGIGGIAAAVTKMCLGNIIGFTFQHELDKLEMYRPAYGAIILEVADNSDYEQLLKETDYYVLGVTTKAASIVWGETSIALTDAVKAYTEPLEKVFPTRVKTSFSSQAGDAPYTAGSAHKHAVAIAKPRIFIPVFPGTNCEYESVKGWERAGGQVETAVVRNLTPAAVEETVEAFAKAIQRSNIIMLPGGFSGGDEPDGSGKFIAAVFRNPRIMEQVMNMLNQRDGLMLGICNGFQALIKLGLVPYGEITALQGNSPTLTHNTLGRHVSCMVNTKIASNLSPWFNNVQVGDIHTIAVSHGEGRFVADPEIIQQLRENGQVATQYVDEQGNPTLELPFNPNGSYNAIEGITSPDGRILGKMGHSERIGENICVNVPGAKDQQLFEAGVAYFK